MTGLASSGSAPSLWRSRRFLTLSAAMVLGISARTGRVMALATALSQGFHAFAPALFGLPLAGRRSPQQV